MADTQTAETAKPKVVTLDLLEYYHKSIKEKFVRKESGKGLSTNDFTNGLKQKLVDLSDGNYETATQEDIDYILRDDDEESQESESNAESLDGPVDDEM